MPGGRRGRALALAGIICTPLLLLACDERNEYVAPPPPKVTVAEPLVEDVTEYLEFTGTTVAYKRVEIPARVPGILKSMHFEPGTHVDHGDLLFMIEPYEYEARVEAAEASLAQAEARQAEAAKTLQRAEILIKKGNISKAKLDEARANFLSAKAEVLVRKADLTRARINLGYTKVTAPISGRVGRNLVDILNLVGQGEATILTDITTYDPMYVYFEINERDLLRVLAMERGQIEDDRPAGKRDSSPVEVGLANDTGYPHLGITDFAESRVDPDTGTLRVRGILDNPGRQPALIPGLFVRIRIPISERPNMPHVSERAIGFDQSGSYIMVVNSDNQVEKRNVTLGVTVDGLRVVEQGLERWELVVVSGVQRAREGAKVDPEEIDMETFRASAIEQAITERDRAGAREQASGTAAPSAAEN